MEQNEMNLQLIGQCKLLLAEIKALVKTLPESQQEKWIEIVIRDCESQGISTVTGRPV